MTMPARSGRGRGRTRACPGGRGPTRRVTTGDSCTGAASAHAGRLMVKEMERPSAGPVTVTVDLPTDPDEAERVAECALGTVVQLLDRGAPVVLDTMEPSGPVLAPVADRRAAGRRPGAGRVPFRRLPIGRRCDRHPMSVVEAIRRANRPGPPEDSIRLRVACPGHRARGDRRLRRSQRGVVGDRHRGHGARFRRHGLLVPRPGPTPPGGSRWSWPPAPSPPWCGSSTRVSVSQRRHHDGRGPADPPPRVGAGRPFLPRAVPT